MVDWAHKLESLLNKNNVDDALWLIETVPVSQLDVLTPIMDKHKDKILIYLLKSIKLYGLTDSLVDQDVLMVQKTRVKWPELFTILNSMHYERSNKY